ncbi:hypothetical protein Desti_1391 [Desulfomonile tiedjei DSM 6799]|uniref:Uncharacterized protein n=1 Tax=Desulfomonile tiedjei (strain ATCC 49306 / DSM 6799 / DCB-1) TaxID=706587 RepID=I4C3G2_DESTA|nr:hypothetical protein Desti_1391 [Desulfomonile tiedjei DSM 6799]
MYPLSQDKKWPFGQSGVSHHFAVVHIEQVYETVFNCERYFLTIGRCRASVPAHFSNINQLVRAGRDAGPYRSFNAQCVQKVRNYVICYKIAKAGVS